MIKKLFSRLKRRSTEPSGKSYLMNTYNRIPLSFAKGDGLRLWDQNSNEYIDGLGGIAVSILGHGHPEFLKAAEQATNSVLHVSNLYQIPAQEELGKKLCSISEMDKAFLCNSGTEANEVAIKIARKFGNDKGIEQPVVITAQNSFHGRTMAALAATGNEAVKKGFEPMLSGFEHVAYNDIEAIRALSGNESVVAVMLEPIQGEAGVVVPDAGYLKAVRELCDENGWLLLADEIQTGIGRTGKWCAYQHEAILPDVVTFAKALGNGIPIGACLARGDAASVLQPGNHGTTFGGNPFASTMALSVLEILESENLVSACAEMGDYLMTSLKLHLDDNANVVDIRGKGLMLAVELSDAYDGLLDKLTAEGLIANVTGGGKVIRLLPAAVITQSDADRIAKIIGRVVKLVTA